MMIGYIKAFKPELKIKDYELYRGIYCSLCKTLGRMYSPIAQLLLSYDFTFLSVVRLGLMPQCSKFERSRCCYNPAKKCLKCTEKEELERSADIVVIMSYYKLKDNIADSGFLKKVLYGLLLPVAALMHRKAMLRMPFLEAAIKSAITEQSKLEKGENISIDEAADPTAKALGAVFSQGYYGDDKQLLWRFGYMLGRWVYLIDAADDLEDDIKSGSFNPFKAQLKSTDEDALTAFREYAAGVLNATAGEVAAAFEKMNFYRFHDLAENIVYDGMYSMQNKVLKQGRCEEE